MKFSEFEKMMQDSGFNTLADIARALNATPQAVSNWKSRDQVPYHIVAKIRTRLNIEDPKENLSSKIPVNNTVYSKDKDSILFTDVLLMITKQLKVIFLVTFISVFVTFTYVQFLQTPEYVSSGKILLPSNGGNNLSGLAGLANQFGVNVPTESSVLN